MPIRDKVKKTFREEGIVLYREFKKATNEFQDATGKTVQAQPNRWVVGAIFSENFDKENGFLNHFSAEFRVPDQDAEKYTYGAKVVGKFEMTQYGLKPVQDVANGVYALELKNKQ